MNCVADRKKDSLSNAAILNQGSVEPKGSSRASTSYLMGPTQF